MSDDLPDELFDASDRNKRVVTCDRCDGDGMSEYATGRFCFQCGGLGTIEIDVEDLTEPQHGNG